MIIKPLVSIFKVSFSNNYICMINSQKINLSHPFKQYNLNTIDACMDKQKYPSFFIIEIKGLNLQFQRNYSSVRVFPRGLGHWGFLTVGYCSRTIAYCFIYCFHKNFYEGTRS